MTITFDKIIPPCILILQEVGYHNNKERRFITAYQIWERLLIKNENLSQTLKDECRGEDYGKGANKHVSPPQKIAQALGRGSDLIETQYLDTRYLKINEVIPSGDDCGIFRLRD